MKPDFCKLTCLTGSECDTCDCNSPRDCRRPCPRNERRQYNAIALTLGFALVLLLIGVLW